MALAPRLTLSIRNFDALDNGLPIRLELDQRGAMIGRSPTADWSLPDPRSYISSRHCEISYQDGQYRLTDVSTNGTFVNGSGERVASPYVIADGDVLGVGHYEIVASLSGGAAAQVQAPTPAASEWTGWEAPPEPAAPVAWGATTSSTDSWGAASAGSSSFSSSEPATAPAYSPWGEPAATPAPSISSSPWSSEASDRGGSSTADDIWGTLAQNNNVDWSRGGFGAEPAPAPTEQHAFVPPVVPQPAAPPPPPAAMPSPPAAAAAHNADLANAVSRLLSEAGLQRSDLKTSDEEAAANAGKLLGRLISGLVIMMEARARAKSQMGAQSTIFSRDGNNPLKFARSPSDAVAHLLNPPVSGFMPADRAIEDSFRDLQSHQMATLKAMQGALRATLKRFSPDAIRKRAESRGIIARILPGARDAALWQAYEKEFGGVAQGSDEAFMDVFAKEFRRAYDEQASKW